MPFKPRNTERARELRKGATVAERVLWGVLRGSALGVRFSRQMPIGPYFADFLCRERRLVIEVDGFSHGRREAYDARRDAWMAAAGYRVLRFGNDAVMRDLDGVRARIVGVLAGEG